MKIRIETGTCRNSQCGDWQRLEDGTILITVVEMPVKSQIAVAIHELIEQILCEEDDVTDTKVTQHDAQFESERSVGKHPLAAEAGADYRSPYRDQHLTAEYVERSVCYALRLPWQKHEHFVQKAT